MWSLLLRLSFPDPGALLSTTTSIALSATLVSVATNIGGGLVFGGSAGLVFRDAQNPPIFDFNSKHPFRRFAGVFFQKVEDLSCFSFFLHASFELLACDSGGTFLRLPGIFIGTYLCRSRSSSFL